MTGVIRIEINRKLEIVLRDTDILYLRKEGVKPTSYTVSTKYGTYDINEDTYETIINFISRNVSNDNTQYGYYVDKKGKTWISMPMEQGE